MFNRKARRQIDNRLKDVNNRLARTQNADEEARLLNELLYLQGASDGLDLGDGRDDRLLMSLRGRR